MTYTAMTRAASSSTVGNALLTVRDLSVRFRTEDGPVLAVDAVGFEVAEQEVLALVGESGCCRAALS